MEKLNQFEGKKRPAGEELVYDENLAKGGYGRKKKQENNRKINKRDNNNEQNQDLDGNLDIDNDVDTMKTDNRETAKSFNNYKDLKSEKFEFYYRVKY